MENLSADVPGHLAWADELLTRFGRWAMDRRRVHHCGSAEGKYKAPANDDDRKPREVLMPGFEAMEVQRVLSRVPEQQRVVLEVLYIPRRWTVVQQMRFLRIPPKLSRERHLSGLQMFANLRRVGVHSAPTDAVSDVAAALRPAAAWQG